MSSRIKIHQRRYLGAKTKLLEYIEEVIEKEKVEFATFLDVFAGTGVVGHHFNNRAAIYLNDILYCNLLSYHAFMGTERIREPLLQHWIHTYNELDVGKLEENYFSENFADTYYSKHNCKMIGYIREDIERLYTEAQINFRERAYLITSLLYAMDRIANTVGHYDAFRKVKDLERTLSLRMLETDEDHNQGNRIFQKDANQLVRELSADLIYIDPPYNSRQYSDSYHLLENVAAWEKPIVHGVALKMDRSHIKSQYNLRSAATAFVDLIQNIQAQYIVVSYNDMGTNGCERSQARITDIEIIAALKNRGTVTVYEKEFPQFTTGKSTKDDLRERLFFCRVEHGKRL